MKACVLMLLPTLTAASQTAPAKVATARPLHRTTVAAPASACAKLPELSPKIPALPAGSSCPKPLYTITTTPAVRLENVSPLEGSNLAESLGIESSTFTLAYVDTRIGAGEAAAPHKYYFVNYTGYLADGTKFDSSFDRNEPLSIAIGQHQVIPGWDTGFAGMHVGGKRRLFIPFQLAYGPSAHGPIPPKSELIFDLELVSVSDVAPKPKTPSAPPAQPGLPLPKSGTTQPAKVPTDPTKPATDPTKPATDPTNQTTPIPASPVTKPTDPTKPTINPSVPPTAQ